MKHILRNVESKGVTFGDLAIGEYFVFGWKHPENHVQAKCEDNRFLNFTAKATGHADAGTEVSRVKMTSLSTADDCVVFQVPE